jgi:hypothetical protein
VRHLQEAGKPVLSVLRNLLDILPPVRAADHSDHRHHEDGKQGVIGPSDDPRVLQRREVFGDLQKTGLI